MDDPLLPKSLRDLAVAPPIRAGEPEVSLERDSGLSPLPVQARRAGCPGPGAAGEACRMTPRPSGFCVRHDPAITDEQRQEWAQRGGLRSVLSRSRLPENLPAIDFSTPEALRAEMERTAELVRSGRLSPAQGNNLKGLIDSALKLYELALAVEVERNLREEQGR